MSEQFLRTKDTSKKTSCDLQEPLAFVTGTERVVLCFPSTFFVKGEGCYKDVSVSLLDRHLFKKNEGKAYI